MMIHDACRHLNSSNEKYRALSVSGGKNLSTLINRLFPILELKISKAVKSFLSAVLKKESGEESIRARIAYLCFWSVCFTSVGK